MANWYIWSGAGGTASGADWTNAKLTLAAALAAGAANDNFWVAHDHAETQASAMVLTSPSNGGTAGVGSLVHCVNRAGSVPPVSADLRTTATITTTAANSMEIRGTHYFYGIIFNCGTGASAANLQINDFFGGWQTYQNCALKLINTSTSSRVQLGHFNSGNNASKVKLIATTLGFANASQAVEIQTASLEWLNTPTAVTGTMPTSLFIFGSFTIGFGPLLLRGVDLSPLGSATIVAAPNGAGKIDIIDCKLGSGAVIATTPTNRAGTMTNLVRCDSGATNYRTERYGFEGSQTVETSIVRTGGATDGTTTISWKIVTNTDSRWVEPFESLPIAIWNDTSGASKTVTVYGIWGTGSVPNNDDIWIELEYLGSAASPQGSFIHSSKANNLETGSALSSDSSTWSGSTTKFKTSVTFTPQLKGPVTIVVKAAKASSTFYIDPKPDLT